MHNATGVEAEVERIGSDPALLAAFVESYRGRHDPVDALWWLAHPAEAAPSGRPSPVDALRPLEAVVYGPPSPTIAAATDELHRLTDSLEAERQLTRAAADAALLAGATTPGTAGSAPGTAGSAPGMGSEAPGTSEAAEGRRGDGRARPGRRIQPTGRIRPIRRRAVALIALGAALLGVGGGLLLGHESGDPPVDATAALAVFDQPQTTNDLPLVQLDAPGLQVLSFRSLVDSPPVYVARNAAGDDVCLVLVQPPGQSAAGCAPADDFPAAGITLKGSYQNPGSVQADDPGAGRFRQVDVTWLPDGSVAIGETPGAELLFGTAG